MAVVIEKIAKVSNQSVLKGTKRDWNAWISILDKAGGRSLTHKELVALLKKKYKLSVWWQQGVATGYEIHIGRKAEGRNEKGEYSSMASRTLPVGVKACWKFLNSPEGMSIWLKPMGEFSLAVKKQFEVEGGIYGEVRTMKTGVRARLTWRDEEWAKNSVLQIYLIPRTSIKSILVFHHDKLPSDRARLQMRDQWKNVLDEIVKFLGGKR